MKNFTKVLVLVFSMLILTGCTSVEDKKAELQNFTDQKKAELERKAQEELDKQVDIATNKAQSEIDNKIDKMAEQLKNKMKLSGGTSGTTVDNGESN